MLLLLTQLRARERRIIPFLPPPRQHPPSNHRDPFSTSTVPTSPITLQSPLSRRTFTPKRRPAASNNNNNHNDDAANVARQIRWPFS
jgi:hypothetical protein